MAIDSQMYLQPLIPVGTQNSTANYNTAKTQVKNKQSFANVLKEAANKVNFSQHALSRLKARNIELSDDIMGKLNDTVEKMAQKGARESLIYLDGTAFVVSIANKTVITAMDGPSTKNNIFTNIDSAAIL